MPSACRNNSYATSTKAPFSHKTMTPHPVGSLPTEVAPLATPGPAVGKTGSEKKWQVDRASGVPAPVIRANMISLRLSPKGQIKVAFFSQG
jgi:hypothetical protein